MIKNAVASAKFENTLGIDNAATAVSRLHLAQAVHITELQY
jgi:hypothetical protein